MKKNDGEMELVHYLSQSNRGRPLYVEPSNAASAFASSLFYRELSSIINQIGLTLWFVSKIVAVSYKQQWIVILKRHQLK